MNPAIRRVAALGIVIAVALVAKAGLNVKQVEIQPEGGVLITLSDGKKVHQDAERLPESDALTGPAACSQAAVSSDGSAAGWFVENQWRGATYAVPGMVVVYRPGKPLRRIGFHGPDHLVMSGWAFVSGARQVALRAEPFHGPGDAFYELHDVETGRVVGAWIGDLGDRSPAWAKLLKDR
jgi:hypothetical protein